jgi:outer membrane receptor protein involved in Fe transport
MTMIKQSRICLGAAPLLLAGPVLAGDVVGSSAVTTSEAGLTEIVVTATRREESLQDVPVSVNAVSAAELQQNAIVRLQDLQLASLTVQETGIGNNIFIRGIGSGINPGFEQSAGTYVDGVYRGRGQQSRAPLLDVSRVEILRGPQTTLFGKNSVAGAINVTTAGPTRDFEGYVNGSYDFDLGEQQVEAALSGPLSDRARGRLSGRYLSSDGFVENLTMDRDEAQRDDYSLRGQVQFDVTDNLTATVKAEVGSFDKDGRSLEVMNERPATAGPFAGLTYSQILLALGQPASVANNTLDYRRSGNDDTSRNDSEEYVLTLDWLLGEHTLTSISAWSGYDFDEHCDCDFTGADIFNVALSESFDQFSQEIRLASPVGRTVDYLVGGYFDDTSLEYRDSIQVGSGSVLVPLINARLPGAGTAIGNTGTPRVFEQDATSWSLFARATWNVSDDLRLNLGARYADERKDASRELAISGIDGSPLAGIQALVAPAVYAQVFNVRAHSLDDSRSESHLMPSASVQYDLADDVMAYASYTEGFKSGGYDARSNNPTSPPAVVCTGPGVPAGCIPATGVGTFEFKEEKSESYELGLKSRFAHDRAEVNVAYFYTDFTNLQVSTFDGVLGFNVKNAGAAQVQGIELDARWALSEYVALRGSAVWTDFEYQSFIGQCYTGQSPNAPDGVNCDYAGQTNQYVPDLAGNLAVDFSMPVGAQLKLGSTLELVYSDDYYPQATLDPTTVQDAFAKVNLRLSIGAADGIWELAVLGRNLTDETVTANVTDMPLAARTFGAPSYGAFVEPPRSVAVQGTIRF